MITTVTLNATIDKTCFLGPLKIGQVNKVPVMHTYPGGKGINAARVAQLLGGPVLATGFTAGYNGAYIEMELSRQGILHDFVKVEGESRVSLNIIDHFSGKTTEILEQGPVVSTDDVLVIKDKVRQLAQSSSVIAISGSIPAGAPNSLYADFVEIAQAEGAKVLLDASGEPLVQGLSARPFFVKPNEHEIEALLGMRAENEHEMIDLIRLLLNQGIGCVAITLGQRGALCGWDEGIFRIRIPEVNTINAVGCGDAFVGAMTVGLYRGESLEDCLRSAAAAGTANAMSEEAGNISLDDYKEVLSKVSFEPVTR